MRCYEVGIMKRPWQLIPFIRGSLLFLELMQVQVDRQALIHPGFGLEVV